MTLLFWLGIGCPHDNRRSGNWGDSRVRSVLMQTSELQNPRHPSPADNLPRRGVLGDRGDGASLDERERC